MLKRTVGNLYQKPEHVLQAARFTNKITVPILITKKLLLWRGNSYVMHMLNIGERTAASARKAVV